MGGGRAGVPGTLAGGDARRAGRAFLLEMWPMPSPSAREERAPILETRGRSESRCRASRGDIDGIVETLRLQCRRGGQDPGRGDPPRAIPTSTYVDLEPVGVTAHIVPWNFPLGMAVRSLAPALAAGCTAVREAGRTIVALDLALRRARPRGRSSGRGCVDVVCGFGPRGGGAARRRSAGVGR